MSASVYNLYIEQGATYELTINVTSSVGDFDLNDYTPKAQLRILLTDKPKIINFTCTVESSSVLVISLTPEQTSSLGSTSGYDDTKTAFYDLELTNNDNGKIIRLLNGSAQISPEVSVNA